MQVDLVNLQALVHALLVSLQGFALSAVFRTRMHLVHLTRLCTLRPSLITIARMTGLQADCPLWKLLLNLILLHHRHDPCEFVSLEVLQKLFVCSSMSH